jgi:hypothetical protein
VVYVCTGFLVADVDPSPKDQFHEVGEFVELSVNVTVNGAVPDVGVPVKLVTGTVKLTVMYPTFRVLLYPSALYACIDT